MGLERPRRVVFVGPGLHPWSALLALLVFIGPGVATPLILHAVDANEFPLELPLLVPSGAWLVALLAGIFTSVWRPLQARARIARGVHVTGTVSEVSAGRPPRKVTVGYHDERGVRHTARLSTRSFVALGDPVTVAFAKGHGAGGTVIELGPWRLDDGRVSAGGVSPGRMLVLLALIGVAMTGLFSSLGRSEFTGERVIPPAPWKFPTVALLTVGAIAWRVRRHPRGSPAAVWDGLTVFAVPLALVGLGGLLGQALPITERRFELEVLGHACLDLEGAGRVCLLELQAPEEVSLFELVRVPGPSPWAPGTRLEVVRIDRWFSASTLRGQRFTARDWQPETTLEEVFVDKRHTMKELLRAHQVKATGQFSPHSLLHDDLLRLGALAP